MSYRQSIPSGVGGFNDLQSLHQADNILMHNDVSAIEEEDDFLGSSSVAYAPLVWKNICESFLDPLKDDVDKWLRDFPNDNEGTEAIHNYLRDFSYILCAIADSFGAPSSTDRWRRASIWLEANISVDFCAGFETRVRDIYDAVDTAATEYLDTEPQYQSVVLKDIRYVRVEEFLDYLTDLTATLRQRLDFLSPRPSSLESNVGKNLPILSINEKLCQARYDGNTHDLTSSQTYALKLIVDANDWISMSGHGFSKISETMKTLPEQLQGLFESKSGKGYRLKPRP